MTTTIIPLAIGILLGAVICYLVLSSHLRRKYEEHYTRLFNEDHEHDFAVMAFLRWIHGAGCQIIIKDVSRDDIERNPDQADEQLKLMYKTYYNDTFKQITGRSWLDSDN